MPETITSIEPEAFYGCSRLVNLTIRTTSRTRRRGFFLLQLASEHGSPRRCPQTGDRLFLGCVALTNVRILEMQRILANPPSHYCHQLRQVDIPNGVTNIANSAFSGVQGWTRSSSLTASQASRPRV